MKNIKTNWKLFKLEDICDDFTHGNSITEEDRIKGNYPYISATAKNNGNSDFISNTNNSVHSDIISVNSNGSVGYAFYHPYLSIVSSDCIIIKLKNNKNKNKSISLFIVNQIMHQKDIYSYNYKLSEDRLKNLPILLPVDDEGNIDFDFIEDFISEQYKSKLLKYKLFLEKSISNLKFKEVPSLKSKTWQEFLIDEIFDIEDGVRLKSEDMEKGNIPFIGATSLNNGVTHYVSNINDSLDCNVLGVNYNGSVLETFYHPYYCLFSDDVKRFHLKNYEDNKYVLLFFKNILKQQQPIFNFNYKFNKDRMKKQKILVPVDKNNEPDYKYMEQYMINLELKALTKYKNYLSLN